MCHEYTSRVRERERDDGETGAEAEDDLPAFANEEGSEDAEVLTDGGDES